MGCSAKNSLASDLPEDVLRLGTTSEYNACTAAYGDISCDLQDPNVC
eukprot:CAMPEP_0197822802 /NCGR_PEP_ID=MMETSP1437-20131217/64_1 /TAXON_ID=49252 ORGANISM="Eucampia antarctica, Strain CCMP1452" /NCGR_SAMPLE_ID=MMETSP1437 /ASSEMBLY_ACC=CAM_ASM_001096 /LENGTH=46 /DNA_ID= /DNA_START= /DNA_END= /DNA_ORIENTATION=